jgi:hypothetical protein
MDTETYEAQNIIKNAFREYLYSAWTKVSILLTYEKILL